MKLMIWVKVHAYVKLVEVWNIYDTAVSIIFSVGFFISFCCVTLRFTFWKLHSYKHKPLFPEEQILLFVILFLFCPSLLSPFCLSLPLYHKHSLFFPLLLPLPLVFYFNVLGGLFFPAVFLCAFWVDHTKSTVRVIREGNKRKCHR